MYGLAMELGCSWCWVSLRVMARVKGGEVLAGNAAERPAQCRQVCRCLPGAVALERVACGVFALSKGCMCFSIRMCVPVRAVFHNCEGR